MWLDNELKFSGMNKKTVKAIDGNEFRLICQRLVHNTKQYMNEPWTIPSSWNVQLTIASD